MPVVCAMDMSTLPTTSLRKTWKYDKLTVHERGGGGSRQLWWWIHAYITQRLLSGSDTVYLPVSYTAKLNIKIYNTIILQDCSFLQWRCLRMIKTSGTWHWVTGHMVPVTLKDRRSLHLQGKAIQDCPWRWRSCKISETPCPSTKYNIPDNLNLWL
jgi:hypothetical protein